MLKVTESNIDNFEKFYIRHVFVCIEVGNVARLKSVIRQHSQFVEETGRADFIKAFAEARAWLTEAEQFELINGPGSRFNAEHPFVVEFNQRMTASQRL
jgi:hypothetical protein